MNQYLIDNIVTVSATNEYSAVMQVCRSCENIYLLKYNGNDEWEYAAIFRNGEANVIVKKL